MSEQDLVERILSFSVKAIKDWKSEDKQLLGPTEADNYLSSFSGIGAMLEEEMGRLTMEEPVWKGSQDQKLSEAKLDRLWQVTEDGQRQIQLKYRLRAVDKICAACKARLRRLNNESFNQS